MKPDLVMSSSPQLHGELHALLDAAVDGVVLIDDEGIVQAFNRAAERLFGYTADEVLGHNVSMLMPEPDRSNHGGYVARYRALREPHIIGRGREVKARRKDGSVFPVLLSVGVVPGSEPPRFVGFVHDLTLRRKAEEERNLLQERLRHVSRLATVGEMASGVAHELNQPLAAVANYAQACHRLLALPDPDIEEIRDALKQIASQAVRAGEIIRRLRGLARDHEAQRGEVDINVVVQELSDLIQPDATRKGVHCRLELTADLPRVLIDCVQIQQVVLNLVRNAFEALADGRTAGPREVVIRTALWGQRDVEISVCDSGPGVPQEIARRLFEPFCTTKPGGTGLGLAASRTIVRDHGGTLDHLPNTPAGACFVVRLPAHNGG